MDERLNIYEEKMNKTMNNLAEEYGGIRDKKSGFCLAFRRSGIYGDCRQIKQITDRR